MIIDHGVSGCFGTRLAPQSATVLEKWSKAFKKEKKLVQALPETHPSAGDFLRLLLRFDHEGWCLVEQKFA